MYKNTHADELIKIQMCYRENKNSKSNNVNNHCPPPLRLHIDYLQHGRQSTTLLRYADSHAWEDFMDTPISSSDQLSYSSLIIIIRDMTLQDYDYNPALEQGLL